MKKAIYLIVFSLFIISCQDDFNKQDKAQFEDPIIDFRSDVEQENIFDLGGQLVTDTEVDDSLFDKELTRDEFESLNLGIDPSILDYVQISLVRDDPSPNEPPYNCHDDQAEEYPCCSTNTTVCFGTSYRIDGCFKQISGASDVFLNMKFFIDNVLRFHLFSKPAILPGCNLYEPFAVRYPNGNVAYYLCFNPLSDPICPAKIRVETKWIYYGPTITYNICGFNSETFNWPGYPELCPSED